MKKILLFTLTLIFFFTYCYADINIASNKLPDNINNFIKKYFHGNIITSVIKNDIEYKLRLTNNIELEFDINGAWKKVKINKNFPTKLLPKNIINNIIKLYPNTNIIEVERMWNGYQIKLNNKESLFIYNNGSIRQK